MDFVQRNLINERNNLQIELAKAKLLIAQLNENAHVSAANAALNDAEKHWNPKDKEYFREAEPHLKIARGALDAAKSAGVEGELINKAQNNHDRIAARIESKPQNEQAEYISSLENAVIALAESMNMSPEDLLREGGEARNRRIALGLNTAANTIGAGKQTLGNMSTHVSNVAKTEGGEAANAAESGLSRSRFSTERSVRNAQAKSGRLETALNTGTAAVTRSRASRVARGSFSDKPKEKAQANRIKSIPKGGGIQTSQAALYTKETPPTYMNPDGKKEITMGTVAKIGPTSSASLAAQGKLPPKKFGIGADAQKAKLADLHKGSADKREDRAAIQSYAQKARNQANRPV